MLKSSRKRCAAWRQRNDDAIRCAIAFDCSVFADIVRPSMNSSTITSRSGTTSSTPGPIPVVAAALVLKTSLTRSMDRSSVDCPGTRITYRMPCASTRQFSLVRPPDSTDTFTVSPSQTETSATASSALDMLALNHGVRGDRGRHHLPEHLDRDIATRLKVDGQVRVAQIPPRREAVAAAPHPADHLPFMHHSLATITANALSPPHCHPAH